MTAQDRYRKAIGIVRDIEAAVDEAPEHALTTDNLLTFADAIVALTGRQRAEPKAGTRKPRGQGKTNGAEAQA